MLWHVNPNPTLGGRDREGGGRAIGPGGSAANKIELWLLVCVCRGGGGVGGFPCSLALMCFVSWRGLLGRYSESLPVFLLSPKEEMRPAKRTQTYQINRWHAVWQPTAKSSLSSSSSSSSLLAWALYKLPSEEAWRHCLHSVWRQNGDTCGEEMTRAPS